jgi:hypothetical protein
MKYWEVRVSLIDTDKNPIATVTSATYFTDRDLERFRSDPRVVVELNAVRAFEEVEARRDAS